MRKNNTPIARKGPARYSTIDWIGGPIRICVRYDANSPNRTGMKLRWSLWPKGTNNRRRVDGELWQAVSQ